MTTKPAGVLPALTTVAAVIVNYKAGDHLRRCVSALRADGVEEITVVDNGSSDGSVERAIDDDPNLRIVVPDHNLGYGGGANAGAAEAAEAGALLVLNPDVEVRPGAVDALRRVLDSEPDVGIVGPAILDTAGKRYPSARVFPSAIDSIGHGFLGLVWPRNPFSRRYRMLDADPDARRECDWVSGACFLVRRRAFSDVGGFDESFFMFSEDVDLCWRLGQRGWRVVFEPSAQVRHAQGVSRAHHPYRMIVAHHRSLLRFAGRTKSGWRRIELPAIALGVAARAVFVAVATAVGRPPA